MANINRNTYRKITELKKCITDGEGNEISTKKLIAVGIDILYDKLIKNKPYKTC